MCFKVTKIEGEMEERKEKSENQVLSFFQGTDFLSHNHC